MPNIRVPPFGLGMPTRLTAAGMYFPSRMCAQMLAPCFSRCAGSRSTVIPSTPAAPLFAITLRHASRMFAGDRTFFSVITGYLLCSSSAQPPSLSRPVWPLSFDFGFRPLPSGVIDFLSFDFYSYCRRVRESCALYLQVRIRPFGVSAYYGLC